MKEPIIKAPGPIRGLLDEFARLPEGRRTFVAGMIAVVLHAVVFLGGGLAIFRLQRDHAATKRGGWDTPLPLLQRPVQRLVESRQMHG